MMAGEVGTISSHTTTMIVDRHRNIVESVESYNSGATACARHWSRRHTKHLILDGRSRGIHKQQTIVTAS